MQEMVNKLLTQQKNFLEQVLKQRILEDYQLSNKLERKTNLKKFLLSRISQLYNLRLRVQTQKQRNGRLEMNGLEMTKQ